jgi:transposase
VIAQQARAIEELSRANARLSERVTQLERVIGRNSGNSSMPPSSDDLPGKTKPAGKPVKESGRARGKQKGAPGSCPPWVASPDEWVAHRPKGNCGCGADLAGATDVGIERSHQEHDLPEIRLRVRQHDVYRVRCECGREHVGSLPEGVSPAPSSYGTHLKSLVVYLLVYQHLPIERCVMLIRELTSGTAVSSGFAHGMLTRCAAAVRPVVAQIKELISRAPVAGFDETTLRAGAAGQKRYVLSASTPELTAYHLGRRDLASFTAFGILPRFAGIAVHDRYQNYYHPCWTQLGGHQACCAHLLRDFTDAAESYPSAHWPEQAHRTLRGLIHAAHQARDSGAPQIPSSVAWRASHIPDSGPYKVRPGMEDATCQNGGGNTRLNSETKQRRWS